jgi:hypothetical protein
MEAIWAVLLWSVNFGLACLFGAGLAWALLVGLAKLDRSRSERLARERDEDPRP